MNTQIAIEALAESVPKGSGSTAALRLHVGRGLAGLAALRADWIMLAQALPDGRFHHQYEWYLSYLRHLEQDPSSVHFFAFFRERRAVAIFPLRWTRGTLSRMAVRIWELPSNPHMNLCDALIAPEENVAVLFARLLEALRDLRRPWDVLHLPNLLDGAAALRALRTASPARTLLARTGQSMYFPCADLDSALGNTTKEFRRNLRRQRRKLEQRGRVEAALVREAEALDDAFADFLEIEASGWKGGAGRGSAIKLHPPLSGFYRELIAEFGAGNRCLINLLKLDGKTVAAQFCLLFGNRANLLKIAYDERFSAEAPGSQLLHEMLSHCCAAPSLDELSLVTGPAWAVGRWNPEAHAVWTARVFNATPRGLAVHAMTHLRTIWERAKAARLRPRSQDDKGESA